MTYSQAKKSATDLVESARAVYLKKLVRSKAFKTLKAELNDFENKAGETECLNLDECGFLVSRHEIKLDESLSSDDKGNPDTDLIRAVLNAANESLHYGREAGKNWYAEICFGEPCIVNASPERDCYAVYSNELKLKIDRIDSELYGLMLVEQAMRKHGIFVDVVSCDRYGTCYRLTIPKNVVEATDSELAAMIDAIENKEGKND